MEKNWRSLAHSLELGEQLTEGSRRDASAPITTFLRGQASDPETVKAIGNALITTCETLGVSERDDTSIQLVAQKIIELAQRGLQSPTELHLAAMKEFKSDPQ